MIPPFTGNGMAMAFQSAECALPSLIAHARGDMEWDAACRVTRITLRRLFRLRLFSARALHPFLLRPRPQRWFALLGDTGLLPFTPLAAWFGFTPLPPAFFAALLIMVVAYLGLVEVVKRWFYRRYPI